MKRLIFILIIFFLYSCNNENLYKNAFEKKVKQNIKDRQARIEKVLIYTEELALTQPLKFSDNQRFSTEISKIFKPFFKEILKTPNIKTANSLRKETLNKILKVKKSNLIKNVINELEKPINNDIDKFQLADKINKLYLDALIFISYEGTLSVQGCEITEYQPTKVYPFRVNDSIVVLNFSNNLVTDYPNFFDSKGFLKIDLQKPSSVLSILDDKFIKSYYVKSYSDTLNLSMEINTKEAVGVVVTKDEKEIIVGKPTTLKTNFDDFFDRIEFPE